MGDVLLFPIPLCPECVGCIGGACAGPDVPWRPARDGEPCAAAECQEECPDCDGEGTPDGRTECETCGGRGRLV